MELWVKFILAVTFINVFGFFIMKNLTNNNNCFVIAGYLFLFSGIIALLSLIYMHYFTNIPVLKLNNIYAIILLAIMNFASYTLLLNAVNYAENPDAQIDTDNEHYELSMALYDVAQPIASLTLGKDVVSFFVYKMTTDMKGYHEIICRKIKYICIEIELSVEHFGLKNSAKFDAVGFRCTGVNIKGFRLACCWINHATGN